MHDAYRDVRTVHIQKYEATSVMYRVITVVFLVECRPYVPEVSFYTGALVQYLNILSKM